MSANKQKTSPHRHSRIGGSLQLKSLLVLFITMIIACILTYVLMYFFMRDYLYRISSQLVEQRAQYLLTVFERSNFTPEELVELYNDNIGYIQLCDSFEEVPPMTGVVVESDMREKRVYLSAQKNFPLGVLKLRDKYLIVSPLIYEWESSVGRRLVVYTLLLCSLIASICTIVTLRIAIKPLKKLDRAIGEVANGNFEVRVKHHGNDEIGKIVKNFNWMVQGLGSIEYLRRDFVSSVSHEFKTPIAAISGSAKLLSTIPHEKLTEERKQKYLKLILDETARMSVLSSNLLRLSRLETQCSTQSTTQFSLDEQLRRSILTLENQWSAKQIEWDIHLDAVQCTADEDLLAQVWINLLSNAIKFTGDAGTILVSLQPAGKMAKVEIADSGIGMDELTLSRIFEKFYQGESSHGVEGNGLGLSIVKRIIDLHQGDIKFSSMPGKGTQCTVLLPLTPPPMRETD